MSEIDDIADDLKKSIVNKIDEMKEEMEEKINEIEDERDTNYNRCQELEEEKEEIERKINLGIYEAVIDELNYGTILDHGDIPHPEWLGDTETTNIGIYDQLIEKIKELKEKLKEKDRKLCKVEKENVLLKNTISKINSRFNEDITFDGECTEGINELTKLIKLQNKLMNNSVYDITVNADKEKLFKLDFTWAEINEIYVHDWDDPNYKYTGNNTFNGFLEFLDIKEYGVNNNRAIKLLCENSSIFEGEKAFGMAITLKKDKDTECGMVYLTSWNMYMYSQN